jgi:hypothetical protein
MSDKRIFLWRAVYLNFPSAPAVPLLVSLFGSMVIFVAFFLEISAGFFLPRAHLSAKSRTLVAYFGLADLGILKKNRQGAQNGSSSCRRIIFHFAGRLWRFVFCKFRFCKVRLLSISGIEAARIRQTQSVHPETHVIFHLIGPEEPAPLTRKAKCYLDFQHARDGCAGCRRIVRTRG